jgi:GNAT superfamily N-acetyltransferase
MEKFCMPIIELKTASDFAPALQLLQQLNPAMTKQKFEIRLKKMLSQGYRCIAYVEEGKMLGLCGFWYGTRLWCGDFIDLDNVVVDEKVRSKGIGQKMIDWVEKEAHRLKCDQLGLDCYTTKHAAHRFYFREGYIIKAYHFIKPLNNH